jgi:hypothetical protein
MSSKESPGNLIDPLFFNPPDIPLDTISDQAGLDALLANWGNCLNIFLSLLRCA